MPGDASQGGRRSLWDSDVISSIAFHPQKCAPSTRLSDDGSGWVDGTIPVAESAQLAYRLFIAPGATTKDLPGRWCALVYFHANAELCTDLTHEIGRFHECGFQAVLCPEYRGFGWSAGGPPSIPRLCPDAEAIMEAVPKLLTEAGFKDPASAALVVAGRSIGACSAVHAAARCGEVCPVAGLIIESGLQSPLQMPMVRQMGAMMPGILERLAAEPDPLDNLEKLKQVTAPTLIIHGDMDEMIPVSQAVAAHRSCGSSVKKLVRYPRCGHNDLRHLYGQKYFAELRALCDTVLGVAPPEAFVEAAREGGGFFSLFARALRRCRPALGEGAAS